MRLVHSYGAFRWCCCCCCFCCRHLLRCYNYGCDVLNVSSLSAANELIGIRQRTKLERKSALCNTFQRTVRSPGWFDCCCRCGCCCCGCCFSMSVCSKQCLFGRRFSWTHRSNIEFDSIYGISSLVIKTNFVSSTNSSTHFFSLCSRSTLKFSNFFLLLFALNDLNTFLMTSLWVTVWCWCCCCWASIMPNDCLIIQFIINVLNWSKNVKQQNRKKKRKIGKESKWLTHRDESMVFHPNTNNAPSNGNTKQFPNEYHVNMCNGFFLSFVRLFGQNLNIRRNGERCVCVCVNVRVCVFGFECVFSVKIKWHDSSSDVLLYFSCVYYIK